MWEICGIIFCRGCEATLLVCRQFGGSDLTWFEWTFVGGFLILRENCRRVSVSSSGCERECDMCCAFRGPIFFFLKEWQWAVSNFIRDCTCVAHHTLLLHQGWVLLESWVSGFVAGIPVRMCSHRIFCVISLWLFIRDLKVTQSSALLELCSFTIIMEHNPYGGFSFQGCFLVAPSGNAEPSQAWELQ